MCGRCFTLKREFSSPYQLGYHRPLQASQFSNGQVFRSLPLVSSSSSSATVRQCKKNMQKKRTRCTSVSSVIGQSVIVRKKCYLSALQVPRLRIPFLTSANLEMSWSPNQTPEKNFISLKRAFASDKLDFIVIDF